MGGRERGRRGWGWGWGRLNSPRGSVDSLVGGVGGRRPFADVGSAAQARHAEAGADGAARRVVELLRVCMEIRRKK